ncbi:MAG: FmdB family zinc ribbon protein [Candidatus Dormibacteraceae bacterium]
MPLYEYRCEACGGRFERLIPWSAADAQRCPECSEPARRLVSAFASAASCGPESGG